MPELILKPAGRLIKSSSIHNGRFLAEPVVEDVTAVAAMHLMEPVEIDPGFTLFDFFKLLRDSPTLQMVLHHDWAGAYVDAVFKLELVEGSRPPLLDDEEDDTLEYLELHTYWEKNTKTGVLEGNHHLSFHGVGPLLEQDRFSNGELVYRANTRPTYGISFRPVKELLHLPLRYKPEVDILEGCTDDYRTYNNKLETVRVEHPTLGQVLQGVMYELSFHGSPEDVVAMNETVMDVVKEAKAAYGVEKAPDTENS